MRAIVTRPFRMFAALVALSILSASASAQPPGPLPFDPTHYWTYTLLDPLFLPQPILVQDQFFRQPVPVTTQDRVRLLNWVHKNNSAVTDTFLHYTWWNLREKLPVNRQAIVTNQFGSHVVNVLNLEFLLTPAFKNQQTAGGQPPLANHYLCYRAFGFPAPPAVFDFQDEWRTDIQHPQDMEFLCTPCMKNHLGKTFPAVDTMTHFAVYPIFPNSDRFVPFLTDQFQPRGHVVQQIPIEYLFVPSTKTELPTPTKRDTWGRLKMLYR